MLLTKWTSNETDINYRLNLYVLKGYKQQRGFIPNAVRLLIKYNLFNYLLVYVRNSTFPNRYRWKKIVNITLKQFHTNAWKLRAQHDVDFTRFLAVHGSIQQSNLYLLANNRHEIIHVISSVKVLTARSFKQYTCKICNDHVSQLPRHNCLLSWHELSERKCL